MPLELICLIFGNMITKFRSKGITQRGAEYAKKRKLFAEANIDISKIKII